MKTEYYLKNNKYSLFLNKGNIKDFDIYTSAIKKYLPNNGKVLDFGCGPGVVVRYLVSQKINAHGIDISQSSIALAKKAPGVYKLFDGKKIPYQNNYFDVVGSIDVIEHVENVDKALREQLRVIKKDGYLIICAPNFLSLTSNHHYRTRGIAAKLQNIGLFISKLVNYFVGDNVSFGKFDPVDRPDFQPDDDATNLINIIDILKWGKLNKLHLMEYSGSILPKEYPSYKVGRIPLLNLFTGGVFVVFKKP